MKVEELKKKSTGGVVAYSIRTATLYVIAIFATGLLSAFLSPEDFGIYYVVTAVVGIFTFMSDIGLAASLIQKSKEPNLSELRSTFTVQQILALSIFGLTILLTPVWKKFTNLDAYGLELLYALGFSFVLASMKTIPSILLERRLRFDKLVIPQVAEHLVFYGLAVYLAYIGWGVRSYTVAVLSRSLVGVVAMYALQSWQIGVELSKTALRKLLKFGVKFQVNDLLARLKDDLYIVILAKFLPAADMGFIGWAKRWSMFPYQFSVNSVVAITFPTYSRLQDRKELLQKAVEKSIYFITLIIFPVLGGIVVMAYPLTQLVSSYEKWQPALPALYLFCFNIAWAAMSTPLTNTLNAIGKINITLKLMIMWTVLTWGLTPLGLKWFGMTGVALVSAIVGASSIVTIVIVKKILKLKIMDQIWRQILATLLMAVLMWGLRDLASESVVRFGLLISYGAVIYSVLILLTGYNKLKREIASLLVKRK